MKSFTQRWREASDEAEDQPMEDTPTDPKEAPKGELAILRNQARDCIESLIRFNKEADRIHCELVEGRKERDEALRGMVAGHQRLAASYAKCAELEKLIQDAPHGTDCDKSWTPFVGRKPKCTCWKSRLTPAPPEEKRP